MRGVEAAVQTIQGAWRSLLRMRRRQRQRRERQNRAAEVLQRFFRKYPRLRKTRCAAVLPRVRPAVRPLGCHVRLLPRYELH